MTVGTALLLVLPAIGLTVGDTQVEIEGATGFPGRISLVTLKTDVGENVGGRIYPGQVSIQYSFSNICGASVLNENYILTAAHCASDETGSFRPDDLYVLAGTDDLSKGGTRHSVKVIHVHENYNEADTWHNDIAVMRVEPPFVFGNPTSPVTLASPGQITAPGTVATVVGWGRLSEEDSPPNELKKMDLSVTEHTVCKAAYVDSGAKIHEEQMCAEVPEGKKGPCNGDSGGPLLVDGKVVGIVSWSRGCAEKGYPTVFTEVSYYIEWIESKLGYHNRYSELPPRHRIEL